MGNVEVRGTHLPFPIERHTEAGVDSRFGAAHPGADPVVVGLGVRVAGEDVDPWGGVLDSDGHAGVLGPPVGAQPPDRVEFGEPPVGAR